MKEDVNYKKRECYEEDEIDLYELWLTIKKRKWIIILITFISVFSSVIYALFIAEPVYKSEAKILPLGESGDTLSKYQALAGMLGMPVGERSSKLVVILNSDTLKMRVIKRLNLLPVFFPKLWDKKNKKWKVMDKRKIPDIRDGANRLKGLINISQDQKTGVITISVEYPEDPELAYTIANTLLDEAQKIIEKKSFSISYRYRIYLEKQLILVKKKIDLLEDIYIRYTKGEIKTVPYIFNLKESELKRFSFNENIIRRTKIKLNKLEKKINRVNISNSLLENKLNMERLNLQFNLLKNVFVSLYREYEITKLQEKKESLAFDIIDEPYIPKVPYKPKKRLIVTVAGVSGLILGIFLAFFIEWINNIKSQHKREERKSTEAG